MAYERLSEFKITGSDLDAFVDGTLKMYERQLAARNAEDELRFQKLVLEGNIPLEEQISYRTDQMKKVSDDPDERRRVSKEISTLKDLLEQKKYSDDYTQKLVDYESGVSSVDSVIGWLENRMSTTTDQSIKSSIQEQLLTKQKEKFALTQSIIKNQTSYAVNDKTESILNNQITKVSTERNKALLAGNEELISVYDLQLQSLNKAKNENSIENDIRNFALTTVSGYSSATNLLDAYNNKIGSSSVSGPITISGTTYSSAREFWTYKRDSYVSDTSDSGFFPRFGNEQSTQIKIKNSTGSLSRGDLAAVSTTFNTLMSRPELTGYDIKLNAYKQEVLQTGADLLSSKIWNTYQYDFDLNKAMGDLTNLKNLGVNVDDISTKVTNKASEIKTQQVSGIMDRAGTISGEEGIAPTAAVAQASSEGAGAVISPAQSTGKSAEQIASEMATGFTNQSFGTDPRTTQTNPPAATAAPIVPPKPVVQPVQPTPPLLINKQLDFGVKDPQVKALQQFLNQQGFQVASAGEGSPGLETDYFGPLTQAALQKFQASQGIVSTGTAITTGYGRVGPQTLSAIQKLLK